VAPNIGTVQQLVAESATRERVPAELVLAIAVEEDGLQLPALRAVSVDATVPAAGILELRHGRLDTLSLADVVAGVRARCGSEPGFTSRVR
jgi:hypothetical protein